MGVISRLAQGHFGYIRDSGAYMHSHTRSLSTHAIHPVLAISSLKTDADVAAMTILAYTVILRDLPKFLLHLGGGLLRFSTTTSSATPAGTATAARIAASPASTLFKVGRVHRFLRPDWLRLLILFKLLPGRWNEVDVCKKHMQLKHAQYQKA